MTDLAAPLPDSLPALASRLADIPEADLEAVYAHAFARYRERRYDLALGAFVYLSARRPASVKYRKGLAATQKMLGHYSDAEQSYSVASLLDPGDPEPHLGAAECLQRLGDHDAAERTLTGALALAESVNRPELAQRAAAMLKSVRPDA